DLGPNGDRQGAGSALFDHPPGCELGQEVRTFDVDPNEAVEALLARLQDIGPNLRRDSGIVYEQIQPGKLALREINELAALFTTPNVRLANLSPNSHPACRCGANAVRRAPLCSGEVARVVDDQVVANL